MKENKVFSQQERNVKINAVVLGLRYRIANFLKKGCKKCLIQVLKY